MIVALLCLATGLTLLLAIGLIVTLLYFNNKSQPLPRSLCTTPAVRPGCVTPFETDSSATYSHFFQGGVDLCPQLYGSTFDGTLYDWDSTTQLKGDALYSIQRVDGMPNGTTIITWGADRPGPLASRSTIEQVTGWGPIQNSNDPGDLTGGWETGVIFLNDGETKPYKLLPFIHIYKIDLDEDGSPSVMRMWEALIEDESTSFLNTKQLKQNIGAETMFGPSASFVDDCSGCGQYTWSDEAFEVYYMELTFDPTRGSPPASVSQYSNKTLYLDGIFTGTAPR